MTLDATLFVSIVGAITGVAAVVGGYHIAVRSGNFLHPKLRLRVGHYAARKGYRHPLVILFGIPRESVRDYVAFPLPVLLDPGKQPLKNVNVQFWYPKNRDASRTPVSRTLFDVSSRGCHRRTVHFGDRTVVEYEVPILRRNEPAALADMLAYKRTEISSSIEHPRDVVLDDICMTVRAENHGGIDLSFFVSAVWSDSLEELQKSAGSVGIAAILRRNMFMIWAKAPMFFLPAPHRLWMKRMIICQVQFDATTEQASYSFIEKSRNTFQNCDFLPVYRSKRASADGA